MPAKSHICFLSLMTSMLETCCCAVEKSEDHTVWPPFTSHDAVPLYTPFMTN